MTSVESRAVRRIRHDVNRQPFMVIWEVTRACQLACRHCRADSIHVRNPGELSTDEGKRLFDQIASFGTPHPIMILTGGDPFERPDLAQLTAYGSSVGLHMALSPSATPNVTPERLAEMREAGATAMSLSLDGARPETHDAFRGFAGTYERTLTSAALINEAGFRLQVNTTVTRATVRELPELYLQMLDLHVHLWSLFFLVPTGRGQALQALTAQECEDVLHWMVDISRHLAVKTTEAQHFRRVVLQRSAAERDGLGVEAFAPGTLYHWLSARTAELSADRTLPDRPARPPIDTNAGRGFAFIDHLGNVYPSGFLPLKVGNVREQCFTEIYRDAPVMQALRDPSGFGGRCGVCEFREICGGSRSHAYAVTGDPLAADPSCLYTPSAAVVG
jgi:AdoMet-dependent heme synthase